MNGKHLVNNIYILISKGFWFQSGHLLHSAAMICLLVCFRFCAVVFVSPLRSCDEHNNSQTIWNLLLSNLRSSLWQQSFCRLNGQFILTASIQTYVWRGNKYQWLALDFLVIFRCRLVAFSTSFLCSSYVFDRRRLLDMRRIAHSLIHALVPKLRF